jgi:hypothetical protein
VAKVAIGGSDHQATVDGRTVITDDEDEVTTVNGGLLALGTNIGEYGWDDFTVVSEVGVTLRRELGCGWVGRVGYTLIHWGDVARAGEQIDSSINPTQIPPDTLDGAPRPEFPYATSSFWAQGLTLGLEYSF